MKTAKFVSVWDGGYKIETDCKITDGNEVVDIVVACGDDADSVDVLDEEYVTIDGIRFDILESDDNRCFLVTK